MDHLASSMMMTDETGLDQMCDDMNTMAVSKNKIDTNLDQMCDDMNTLAVSKYGAGMRVLLMNGFMDRYKHQWHRFDDSQAPDAVLQLHIREHRERDERGKPQFFFVHNDTIWNTITFYPYLDQGLITNDKWNVDCSIRFSDYALLRFRHIDNYFTFKTCF